jgi:hypothetical protein
MEIGRGNRSPRRKPAPVPLYPQIPHDLTRARTRAAAMGSFDAVYAERLKIIRHIPTQRVLYVLQKQREGPVQKSGKI